MKIDRNGLEFLEEFGLFVLAIAAVALWVGGWVESVLRVRRTLITHKRARAIANWGRNRDAGIVRYKKPAGLLTKTQFQAATSMLLGAWVIALIVYGFLLPDKYKVPRQWEDAAIMTAMMASFIVVSCRFLWNRLSFWLSLAGTAALQVWIIKVVQPTPWFLRDFGRLGFFLWVLLFAMLRHIDQETPDSQDGHIPK